MIVDLNRPLTNADQKKYCGESQKLQVSESVHDKGPLLDSQHHLDNQEGPAAPQLSA